MVLHQPDLPFLGIERAWRQAEWIVSGIVLKGSVLRKSLAVQGNRLAAIVEAIRVGPVQLTLFIQPVYHLHELIPAVLVGLAEQAPEALALFDVRYGLIGSNNQRHRIRGRSGTVGQAPFVDAGGLRIQHLIQRALLIGIQLRRIFFICRL